jgi:hypothetical protein
MGRPPTRPATFKDGWYIEVRNKGSKTGIKLRRDNKEQMLQAIQEFESMKDIIILGESKNGKFVNKKPVPHKPS